MARLADITRFGELSMMELQSSTMPVRWNFRRTLLQDIKSRRWKEYWNSFFRMCVDGGGGGRGSDQRPDGCPNGRHLFQQNWQLHHNNYTIAQLVEHRWSQAMGLWFESRWCSWFFHSNIFPCNLWKNWFLQIPRTLIINIAHWGSPHSGFYVKCVSYSYGLRPTGLCGFTGRVSLMFEWKGLSVLSGLTTTP